VVGVTGHNRLPATSAVGNVRVRVVEFCCLQPGNVIMGPDRARHRVEAVDITYPFGWFTTNTGITVSYNDWYLLRTATYDVLDQDDGQDEPRDELQGEPQGESEQGKGEGWSA
jgi:hypothetical protein